MGIYNITRKIVLADLTELRDMFWDQYINETRPAERWLAAGKYLGVCEVIAEVFFKSK